MAEDKFATSRKALGKGGMLALGLLKSCQKETKYEGSLGLPVLRYQQQELTTLGCSSKHERGFLNPQIRSVCPFDSGACIPPAISADEHP